MAVVALAKCAYEEASSAHGTEAYARHRAVELYAQVRLHDALAYEIAEASNTTDLLIAVRSDYKVPLEFDTGFLDGFEGEEQSCGLAFVISDASAPDVASAFVERALPIPACIGYLPCKGVYCPPLLLYGGEVRVGADVENRPIPGALKSGNEVRPRSVEANVFRSAEPHVLLWSLVERSNVSKVTVPLLKYPTDFVIVMPRWHLSVDPQYLLEEPDHAVPSLLYHLEHLGLSFVHDECSTLKVCNILARLRFLFRFADICGKSMNEELRVDALRILRSLTELGKIGRREGFKGVTRLALSEEDREARDLLVSWMEEESLNVRVDPIGNIFGVRRGSNPHLKPVIMGSHLDTVIDAGIYDGAYGVLSALEVLRRINEEGIETEHPIGVAAFTNEEGVRFQPDMMGSLVKSGGFPLEKAYARKDDDGITVREALKGIGYLGRDDLKPEAYFELHVEQGPVLHKRGFEIGVVEGVQGIAWWRMIFRGEANHAGTTPLDMRKDAMAGAAELYTDLLKYISKKGNTLCTVGKLRLEPGAINVVPSLSDFTVDYRSYDDINFKEGKAEVERKAEEVAKRCGLTLEKEMTADAHPVHFRPEMVGLVEASARKRAYSTFRLPSGAGHDAQFMHVICPTAMIFVPSINGVSHSPGERTDAADLERGANVLFDCTLAKAGVKKEL